MPGYRFCRPDDIPWLIQSVNACYQPHFPEEGVCTLESFKREIREINLWSSSCMVAFESDQILGVIIGCKREDATLIHKIAIAPQFVSSGHGTHLVTSLMAKLAVLGPPRLITYVPENLLAVSSFFKKQGFDEEGSLSDYQLLLKTEFPLQTDLITSITVDQLIKEDLLGDDRHYSWFHATQTIINCKESIKGLAIVSSLKIEGYILFREFDLGIEILRLKIFNRENIIGLSKVLLHVLAKETNQQQLSLHKAKTVEEGDILLKEIGFQAIKTHIVLTANAIK